MTLVAGSGGRLREVVGRSSTSVWRAVTLAFGLTVATTASAALVVAAGAEPVAHLVPELVVVVLLLVVSGRLAAARLAWADLAALTVAAVVMNVRVPASTFAQFAGPVTATDLLLACVIAVRGRLALLLALAAVVGAATVNVVARPDHTSAAVDLAVLQVGMAVAAWTVCNALFRAADAADTLATALQEGRLRASLTRTRARSREVFRRVLHDDVLTALRGLAESSPGSAPAEVLRRSCAEAAESIRSLRSTSTDPGAGHLGPPGPATTLSTVVPVDAVDAVAPGTAAGPGARLADAITRRSALDVEVTVVEGPAPPEPVVSAMAAAGREALRNVDRHSGTDRASLVVDLSAGRARVEITDLGTGFDVATVSTGVGIRSSIRRRLADVSGAADVETRPGAGVTWTLTWPASPDPRRQVPGVDRVGRAEALPGFDSRLDSAFDSGSDSEAGWEVGSTTAPVLTASGRDRRLDGAGARALLGHLDTERAKLTVGLVPLLLANLYLAVRYVPANDRPGLEIAVATAMTVSTLVAIGLVLRRDPSTRALTVFGLLQPTLLVVHMLGAGAGAAGDFRSWGAGLGALTLVQLAFFTAARSLGLIAVPYAVALLVTVALDPASTVVTSLGFLTSGVGVVLSWSLGAALRRTWRHVERRRAEVHAVRSAERQEASVEAVREEYLAPLETSVLPLVVDVADGRLDPYDPAVTARAAELSLRARDDLYAPGFLSPDLADEVARFRHDGGTVSLRPGLAPGVDRRPAGALLARLLESPADGRRLTLTPSTSPDGRGQVRVAVVPGLSEAERRRLLDLLVHDRIEHVGDGFSSVLLVDDLPHPGDGAGPAPALGRPHESP